MKINNIFGQIMRKIKYLEELSIKIFSRAERTINVFFAGVADRLDDIGVNDKQAE